MRRVNVRLESMNPTLQTGFAMRFIAPGATARLLRRALACAIGWAACCAMVGATVRAQGLGIDRWPLAGVGSSTSRDPLFSGPSLGAPPYMPQPTARPQSWPASDRDVPGELADRLSDDLARPDVRDRQVATIGALPPADPRPPAAHMQTAYMQPAAPVPANTPPGYTQPTYPQTGFPPSGNQPAYPPGPYATTPYPSTPYAPMPYAPTPYAPVPQPSGPQPSGPYPPMSYPPAGYPPTPYAQPPYPPSVPAPQGPAAAVADARPPEFEQVEGAMIIARVGPEVILASEVLGALDEVIAANREQIPEEHQDQVRLQLLKQALGPLIDLRMVYLDARRNIPDEGFEQVRKRIDEDFENNQVRKMMKRLDVQTRAQLDAKLREGGSSLERQREEYVRSIVAQQWRHQNVKIDNEVTHDQMLRYYQEHIEDYSHTAAVRWEQLQVRYGARRSQADAWQRLAAAGNQVLGGRPLADVAREFSEGPTASEGGVRDWTTRESLVSTELQRALFTLPVGQLSPILETEGSLQIVRVVERREDGATPFTEVQAEIREKIRGQRRREATAGYMAKVREQTYVWTVFDDPQAAAELTRRPPAAGGPRPR